MHTVAAGAGPTPTPSNGRKPTRILMARHGEVGERWRRTIYGRLDVELSDTGREQCKWLADAVSGTDLAAVVSSGLKRAEAAAERIRSTPGRPKLERIDDPRLLEIDRGRWAGTTIDELRREDPEGFEEWREADGAARAPSGESPNDVAMRVVPALDELAATYQGRTIMIVAHLWVVRSAVSESLQLPMERSGRLALPPGGICDFLWTPPARDTKLDIEIPRQVTLSGFGLAAAGSAKENGRRLSGV